MSISPQPARIVLPKLQNPPSTIFEFLCKRFPQVGDDVWLARIAGQKVSHGQTAIKADTPYRPGVTVFYFREVENEIEVPFQEEILFQNDHLMVVDKPHFLPVTPSGNSVNECLLNRLQRRTGIPDLAPLHRLDRDTAGLVLFSTAKATRADYTQLFSSGLIQKRYLALSCVGGSPTPPEGQTWHVNNRMVPNSPGFRMKIVDGHANSVTDIVLKDRRGDLGYFELLPQTGKKHQLRVHMLSIGYPILNDLFYPELRMRSPIDFSNPLQLLASHLTFTDPVSGLEFAFESKRKLECR